MVRPFEPAISTSYTCHPCRLQNPRERVNSSQSVTSCSNVHNRRPIYADTSSGISAQTGHSSPDSASCIKVGRKPVQVTHLRLPRNHSITGRQPIAMLSVSLVGTQLTPEQFKSFDCGFDQVRANKRFVNVRYDGAEMVKTDPGEALKDARNSSSSPPLAKRTMLLSKFSSPTSHTRQPFREAMP